MTVPIGHTAATRIGWIGTGVMGSAMCGHLLQAGTVEDATIARSRHAMDGYGESRR